MLDLPELDVPFSRMTMPPDGVSGMRAWSGSTAPRAASVVMVSVYSRAVGSASLFPSPPTGRPRSSGEEAVGRRAVPQG